MTPSDASVPAGTRPPVPARYARKPPLFTVVPKWLAEYGAWLVKQTSRPSKAEQVEAAMEFRQQKISAEQLGRYVRSEPFQAYYRKLAEKALKRAQEAFDARAGEAVAAHFEGLELARQAKDYRSYPAFTNKMLDIIKPRKVEAAEVAPQVTINLSGEQLRVLQQAVPLVESEPMALPGTPDVEVEPE